MRSIIDRLFKSKKLSHIIPLSIACLEYMLFLIFGVSEEKSSLTVVTPIVCAVWYFGIFLVIYAQVRNKRCPEAFLNLAILLPTVVFGIYSIVGTVLFIISGFQSFNFLICAATITYSALSLAHSKR